MVKILRQTDEAVEQIASVLSEFENSHENAECIVYRYNPAAIRIRIIDETFEGKSKGERHDYAMDYLRSLSEDVLSQISILLCLQPGESSLLDLEFQDPTPSRL
jgi:stress-induced morphogen